MPDINIKLRGLTKTERFTIDNQQDTEDLYEYVFNNVLGSPKGYLLRNLRLVVIQKLLKRHDSYSGEYEDYQNEDYPPPLDGEKPKQIVIDPPEFTIGQIRQGAGQERWTLPGRNDREIKYYLEGNDGEEEEVYYFFKMETRGAMKKRKKKTRKLKTGKSKKLKSKRSKSKKRKSKTRRRSR